MLKNVFNGQKSKVLPIALGSTLLCLSSISWAASPAEIKKIAEAQKASLTIILTVVLNLKSAAGEDSWGIFKVQATLVQSPLPFGRVIADSHIYCTYKIGQYKSANYRQKKYTRNAVKRIKKFFCVS